jgi:hypothetical protein
MIETFFSTVQDVSLAIWVSIFNKSFHFSSLRESNLTFRSDQDSWRWIKPCTLFVSGDLMTLGRGTNDPLHSSLIIWITVWTNESFERSFIIWIEPQEFRKICIVPIPSFPITKIAQFHRTASPLWHIWRYVTCLADVRENNACYSFYKTSPWLRIEQPEGLIFHTILSKIRDSLRADTGY